MLETAQRLCKTDTNKKEPIEGRHIFQLHDRLLLNLSLTNLRTFVMTILSFAGFLRFDEVVSIKRCDVIFKPGYMKIFLERSKTDVYRVGKWVFISATETRCCPCKNIQQYFDRAGLGDEQSDEYIFRGVTKFSKQGFEQLKRQNKPISYSTTRKLFLQSLENIGLPSKDFGLHSLRSGGATAAANAGITDRLFKQHGRWKSESAKDGYVKDNLTALLTVTKSLGL